MKGVVPKIQVGDIRTEVYNRIKELIYSGYFKNGEKIEEKDLADLLGVSRTPVREALNRLESRSIVVRIPRRGTFLRKLSIEEITELFTIRALLEGNAARMAAKNSTEHDVKKLERIVSLMKTSKEKEALENLNNLFHSLIHSFAGEITKTLLKEYYEFFIYIDSVLLSGITSNGRSGQVVQEHEAIVQSVKERNEEKAEKSAREHAENGLQNVKEKYLQFKVE